MELNDETFVKQFLEAWNTHDVNAIMALMTDDCIFEASFGVHAWGTRYVGAAEVREGVEQLFRSIPDIRWDGIRHSVGEDHVVVEWLTTGTRPDGRRFEVQGCDILTLRGGKIAAKRAYRKSAL